MQQSYSTAPARQSPDRLTWILGGCVIPVLLVLCCIVGVIGVYVVSPNTLEPVLAVLGLAGKARAAAYVPEQAPLFVAMDVDLQQAANFQNVWSAFQKNAQTQTSLDDFRKQFRDQMGCDFDADIAPWWGPDAAIYLTDEANLTVSPTPSRGAPPPVPNVVVAIGTRDAGKSQAAIQKCSSKQKIKSEETYKGNKISLYDPSGAVAVVGKYVLFASTPDAIHAAIDASRGDVKSLDKSDNYKNLTARLPASRVATMYMQFTPFINALSRSQTGIQPQALSQLQAYKGVAVSLGFEPNGVRLDSVVTYDSAKLPACTQQLMPTMTSQNQALQAVPANTLAYLSGVNFKGMWDCSLTQLDPTSRRQVDDAFASLKQMNLDVNADVLSLLTGEYAFAVTPAQPLSRGMPGIGGMVLIEAKDKNLMTTKVDKIATVVSTAGLRCTEQNIKGVSMKVCKLGSASDPSAPAAGYGFINNFFVIAGPTDALNNAVDASKNPLANDAAFLAVKKVLPAKNSGYFYVSVVGVEGLISDNLTGSSRTTYQKDVQPWLKPIKAVGLASDSSRTDSAAGTIFVYITGN